MALAGAAHAADKRAVDTDFAATVAGSAPAGGTTGDELCPLDARVIALGADNAVVYYTYEEGGADAIRVVTTVGPNLDGWAAPARFVSYLVPGQTAEVSVAGTAGTEAASIELAYNGEFLTIRPVTAAQPEG